MRAFNVFLFLLLLPITLIAQYCPNSDFRNRNFSSWEGFIGKNIDSGIVLGNLANGIFLDRHKIISSTFIDSNTCGGLTVPPSGIDYCAKLGNTDVDAEAERLVYAYDVDSSNAILIINYAVVSLGNESHHWKIDPFFYLRVLDSSFQERNPKCESFKEYSDPDRPNINRCNIADNRTVYWKDWQRFSINLSNYIGQRVFIEFTTLDCYCRWDFGYAYIAMECESIIMTMDYCLNSNKAIITAPSGFEYIWNTGDTLQQLVVNNPVNGTEYYCLLNSTKNCRFDLSRTISNTIFTPAYIKNTNPCSRTIEFKNISTVNNSEIISWHWIFGDSTESYEKNPTHTFPGKGVYNLSMTVATKEGCDSTIYEVISIGNVPVASFQANNGCINSSIKFVNQSTPADSIISWHWDFGDGSPIDSSNWNTQHVFTNGGIQTIKLFVTNNHGCSDSIIKKIYIFFSPPPTIILDPFYCQGSIGNIYLNDSIATWATITWDFGSASVYSGSRTGPYKIAWFIDGLQDINVKIQDSVCGFNVDYSTSIFVRPVPRANAGKDTTICYGKPLNLHATGGSSYIWFPPYYLDDRTNPNTLAVPPKNITYTVTVTEMGCTASDDVEIEVINCGTCSGPCTNKPPIICRYDSISICLSGADSAFWLPRDGVRTPHDTCSWVSPMETTLYCIFAYSNGGQLSKFPITVFVLNTPVASIELNKNIVCDFEKIIGWFNGEASSTAAFDWEFNDANVIWSRPRGAFCIQYADSGFHQISLILSEPFNNFSGTCGVDSANASIYLKPRPQINAGPSDTICLGDQLQLYAFDGDHYFWSPQFNLNNPNISNPIALPSVNTTYTVTALKNGCSARDTLTVDVAPPMQTNVYGDTIICQNQQVQITASGGTSYIWYPPAWLNNDTIPNPIANPPINVTYTVHIYDSIGCHDIRTIELKVINAPLIDFSINKDSLCIKDTLKVKFIGIQDSNTIYNWSINNEVFTQGLNQNELILNFDSIGNYLVSLFINQNGCQSITKDTSVFVDGFKIQFKDVIHNNCFGDFQGSVRVQIIGGIPPYQYLWNNHQTTNYAYNLPGGNYQVYVTDKLGCVENEILMIEEPSILKLIIDRVDASCNNICDGKLSAIVSGGSPPYNYLWSNGINISENSEICTGDYKILITDSLGCSIIDTTYLPYTKSVSASFYTDTIKGMAPLDVKFTYNGSDDVSTLWNFNDGTAFSSEIDPIHTFINEGIYEVVLFARSNSTEACTDTFKLIIEVTNFSSILVPNVFTPNNDGFNDFLEIKNQFLAKFHLQIYNRWGNLVFESANPNNFWDGKTMTGMEAAEGTYFYLLIAEGKDKEKYHQQGSISLFR